MRALDKIKVLLLGKENWTEIYQMPSVADLEYLPADGEMQQDNKPYDIVFIDREPTVNELKSLHKLAKAHTLYVTDRVKIYSGLNWLISCKKGKTLAVKEIQDFLTKELRNYYPKPYGEKFLPNKIAIAQGFQGSVKWNGSYEVVLQGDFGADFRQAVYWRNYIPIYTGQAIEFWLEYKTSGSVSIQLVATQFVQGSASEIRKRWEFTEEDLRNPVTLECEDAGGPTVLSILAKGEGSLEIIALHDRYSRRGHGAFLPGGERYVTSEREEVFCYFDPGDRKPPLNVYFSGYKTLEGFEGYNMMRKMGAPFLLIAETRMEGGCFYMGSGEYEKLVPAMIHKHLEELGFTERQLILSGLSMGTYGALYYGCDTRPHAMILGKPLASVGDIAANERLLRPGGFPTSLDVLKYLCGDTAEEDRKRLNDRFWEKFDQADWTESKFVISYMIEDDYDANAYQMLISHLHSEGVQVYGKGIHGKHNDNTSAIVNWFLGQYDKVLLEDFSRKVTR